MASLDDLMRRGFSPERIAKKAADVGDRDLLREIEKRDAQTKREAAKADREQRQIQAQAEREQRNSQREQDVQNKADATNFKNGAVAFFTRNGKVIPITAPGGGQMKKYDNSGVLWDPNTGKPYKWEDGQLREASEDGGIVTKDGSVYRVDKGQPWKWLGYDKNNLAADKTLTADLSRKSQQINEAASAASGIMNVLKADIASDRKRLSEIDDEMFKADEATRAELTKEQETLKGGIAAKEERQAQAELDAYRTQADKLAWSEEKSRLLKDNIDAKRDLAVDPKGFPNTGRQPDATSQTGLGPVAQTSREVNIFDPMGDFVANSMKARSDQAVQIAGTLAEHTREVAEAQSTPAAVNAWTKSAMAPKLAQEFADRQPVAIKLPEAVAKATGLTHAPETWFTPEAMERQLTAKLSGQDKIKLPTGYRMDGGTVYAPQEEPRKIFGVELPWFKKTTEVAVGRVSYDDYGVPSMEISAGAKISPSFLSQDFYRGIPEYAAPSKAFTDSFLDRSPIGSQVVESVRKEAEAVRKEAEAAFDGKGSAEDAWKSRRWSAGDTRDFLNEWQAGNDAQRAAMVAEIDPRQASLPAADRKLDGRWLYDNGFVSAQDARLLAKTAYGQEPGMPDIGTAFDKWTKTSSDPSAKLLRDSWAAAKTKDAISPWRSIVGGFTIGNTINSLKNLANVGEDARLSMVAEQAARSAFASEYFQTYGNNVDFDRTAYAAARDQFVKAVPFTDWAIGSISGIVQNAAGSSIGMAAQAGKILLGMGGGLNAEEAKLIGAQTDQFGLGFQSFFKDRAGTTDLIRGKSGGQLTSALSELRSTLDRGDYSQDEITAIAARLRESGDGLWKLMGADASPWDNDILDPRSGLGRYMAAYLETADPAYLDQMAEQMRSTPADRALNALVSDYGSAHGTITESSRFGPFQSGMVGGSVAPLQESGIELASDLFSAGIGRVLATGGKMAQTSVRAGRALNALERVIVRFDELGGAFADLGKVTRAPGAALTGGQRAWNAGITLTKAVASNGVSEFIEEAISGMATPGASLNDVISSGVVGAIGGIGMGGTMMLAGAAGGTVSQAYLETVNLNGLKTYVSEWNRRNAESPITIDQVLQSQDYVSPAVRQAFVQKTTDLIGERKAIEAQLKTVQGPQAVPNGRGGATVKASPEWTALTNRLGQVNNELAATTLNARGLGEAGIAAVQEVQGLPEAERNLVDGLLKVAAGTEMSPSQEQAIMQAVTAGGQNLAYVKNGRLIVSEAGRSFVEEKAPTSRKTFLTKTETQQLNAAAPLEISQSQTTPTTAPATPTPVVPSTPSPTGRYVFDVTYLPTGSTNPVTASRYVDAATPEEAARKRDILLKGIGKNATVQNVTDLQPEKVGTLPTTDQTSVPQNNAFVPSPETSAWTSGAIRSAISNAAAAFGYKIVDTGIPVGTDPWGKAVNLGTAWYDKMNPGSEIGQWMDAMDAAKNAVGNEAIQNASSIGLHRVWFGHDFATNLPAIVEKFGWVGVPDYIGQLLKDGLTKSGIPFPGVQLLVESGAVTDRVATDWLSSNIGEVFGGGFAFFGTYRLYRASKADSLTKPRVVFATVGVGLKLVAGVMTAQPFLIISGLADAAILLTNLDQVSAAFKKGQQVAKTNPAPAAVEEVEQTSRKAPDPKDAKVLKDGGTGSVPSAGKKDDTAVVPPEVPFPTSDTHTYLTPEGKAWWEKAIALRAAYRAAKKGSPERADAKKAFLEHWDTAQQTGNKLSRYNAQGEAQGPTTISLGENNVIDEDQTAPKQAPTFSNAKTPSAPPAKPARKAKPAPKTKPKPAAKAETPVSTPSAVVAEPPGGDRVEKILSPEVSTTGRVPSKDGAASTPDGAPVTTVPPDVASPAVTVDPVSSTVPESLRGEITGRKVLEALGGLYPWLFGRKSPFVMAPQVFVSPDGLQVSEKKEAGWSPMRAIMVAHKGRVLISQAELTRSLNSTKETDREAMLAAVIDEEMEHLAQQSALSSKELTALWREAPEAARQRVIETYHSQDVLAAGGDWRMVEADRPNVTALAQEFLRMYRQSLKSGATTEQLSLQGDVDTYAKVNPAFAERLAKALGDIARWMREELTGLLDAKARVRFDDAISRIEAKRAEIESMISNGGTGSVPSVVKKDDTAVVPPKATKPDLENLPVGTVVTSDVYRGEREIEITGPAVKYWPEGRSKKDAPDIHYEAIFSGTGRTGKVSSKHITKVVSVPDPSTSKADVPESNFGDIEDAELRAALEAFDEVLPPAAARVPAGVTSFESLPEVTQEDIAANIFERVPWWQKANEAWRWDEAQVRESLTNQIDPIDFKVFQAEIKKITGFRRNNSQVAVANYSEQLKESEAPPILLDGTKFIDGGHRFEAYRKSGRKTIPAVDIGPLLRMDWTGYMGEDPVSTAVSPAAARSSLSASDAKATPEFIAAASSLSDALWSRGYDTPEKFTAFLHGRFADRITPKVLSQVWNLGANTDPDVAVNWTKVHAEAIRPTVDPQADQAATSPKNERDLPTEAQKDAGNFKKGHVKVSGLDIAIEQPAGSVRSGADKDGNPWSVQLKSHYGYVKRTEGKDGDPLDVFIKPSTPLDWSGPVFVINQVDGEGKFDEHKAILGAADEAEARELYLANYAKGWKGLGSVAAMPFEDFREWSKDGDLSKPAETWENFGPDSGTLGIPRSDLPQVKIPDRSELLDFLRERGIGISEETIADASSLFPVQVEYSLQKTENAKGLLATDRRVIISREGYIVDGHHQYLAAGKGPLKVVRVDLPIRAALRAVADFPKSYGGMRFRNMSDAAVLEFEHLSEAQIAQVKAHRQGIAGLEERFAYILMPWYARYNAAAPGFDAGMRRVAGQAGFETGKTFLIRPNPKKITRIVEKAYYDGGVATGKATMEEALDSIKDVLGATFVVSSPVEIARVRELIVAEFGVPQEKWDVKDTIETGSPYGYRDLKLRIPIAPGIIAEVILITPKMAEAKNAAGHPWYELGRSLDALKASNGGVMPAELKSVADLTKEESKAIYDVAWEADGEAYFADNRSDVTASSYEDNLSTYSPNTILPIGEPSAKLTNDSPSGSPTATSTPGSRESLTSQNVEPGLMSDSAITQKEDTLREGERQPDTGENWRTIKLGDGDRLVGSPVRIAGTNTSLGTLVWTEFRDYDGPGSGLFVQTSYSGTMRPASTVEVLTNKPVSFWWDNQLTQVGRARVINRAGIKLNSRVTWNNISPENQAVLSKLRTDELAQVQDTPSATPAPVDDVSQTRNLKEETTNERPARKPKAAPRRRGGKASARKSDPGREDGPAREPVLGDLLSSVVGQREAERNQEVAGGGSGDVSQVDGQPGVVAGSGDSVAQPGGDGSPQGPVSDVGDAGLGGRGTGSGDAADAGGAQKRPATPREPGLTGQGGPRLPLIERPPVGDPGRNYVIPRGSEVAPRGNISKIKANLAAIRIIKAIESEGRLATPEEKAELVKFTGWGAVSQVFDDEKADAIARGDIESRRDTADRMRQQAETASYKEYYLTEAQRQQDAINTLENWQKQWGKYHDALRELLTEEEYRAAKRSTINAHFTSPPIISAMWDIAEKIGFKGGNVLEPGLGIGHFYGLMPERLADRSKLFGVELDSFTARIAKALYPEADIQNTGFQNADIADNSIDLAISNVPFADVPVVDKALEAMGGPVENLHDYFFGKALTKLKPGGIQIFITSAFTMDKGNPEIRKWLAERADLVAAYRLPNDAFKANAGTDVVTDIIVLRKKDGKPFAAAEEFINLGDSTTHKGDPIRVNGYFARHPGNVLGFLADDGEMFAGREGDEKEMTVHGDPNNTPEIALAQSLPTLPENVLGSDSSTSDARTYASVIKMGNIVEKDGKYFFHGQAEPDAALNDPKNKARVKGFLTLRDVLNGQYDLELSPDSTDAEIEKNRADLNKAYDSFVKKHGQIHDRANKALFVDDPDFFRLAGAEVEKSRDKGIAASIADIAKAIRGKAEYTKADIFRKRVLEPRSEPTTADSVEDAFGISLGWRGRVDIPFMASLTGQTPEQVERALIEREIAVRDPETGQILSREQYLSGNVRRKLDIARESGPSYERNVRLLEPVQPQEVGIEDIRFKIGATWIPASVYTSFLDSLGYEGVKLTYHTSKDGSSSDRWEVDAKKARPYGVEYKNFETQDMGLIEIMDALLNFRRITVTKTVDKKPTTDEVATAAAREMGKKVNEQFVTWANADSKVATQLAAIYNKEVNAHAQRTYDGQFLAFPWASKDFDIYPDKKNTVWRAIQEGFGLIAHGVGGGKTIVGSAIALEMRRLGMARKPLIVVHNATLEGFAKEIARMAPTARVLVGRKDELQGDKRREFLMRIAAGDWDAVVVAHSTFGLIDDDPQVEMDQMQSLVDEMMDSLKEQGYNSVADAKESRTKPVSVKNLVKQIERLEAAIIKASLRRTDTGLLNFQQLGIDALIVDEVHQFKKMPFSTKIAAKGIDGSFSKRGYALFMRARQIQEKMGGKNVFTMTGTPVTNTLGEIWNMVRLVAPKLLTEYKITHFDQFVSKFAEIETVSEMGPTGEFKNVERLSKLINIPEWATFLRLAADVKLGDDLVVKNRPGIKGGKPELISVERTKGVTAWVEYIRSVLAAFEGVSGSELMENPQMMAIPVQAYMASRAAAIDIRLIEPRAKDESGSKVNTMIKRAMGIYKSTAKYQGTQVIFADSFNTQKISIFNQLVSRSRLNIALDPKKKEGTTFNLYEDIRAKLIAEGVPADEIAVITDSKWDNDKRKQALFELVNDGKVRFIIGSTQRLGTGVNMQRRMAVAHHLDVPWTPAELEQRDGRVFRQGNIHGDLGADIELLRYGMKDTLDAALWQKLETKQRFTTLALSGKVVGRELEEVDEIMTLAEQRAVLSGPYGQRIFELETRLRELEAARLGYAREAQSRRSEIAYAVRSLAGIEEDAVKAEPSLAKMEALGRTIATDGAIIAVDGQTFKTKKETADAVTAAINDSFEGQDPANTEKTKLPPVTSITVNGVPIYLASTFSRKQIFDEAGKRTGFEFSPNFTLLSGAKDENMSLHFGQVTSAATLLSRLEELSDTVESIRSAKARNAARTKQLAGMDVLAEWPMQAEYDAAAAELVETRDKEAERLGKAPKPAAANTKDAEYLAAVENQDMITAQRLVDEAAKAAGFDSSDTVWHASQFGEFEEFRPWSHFGTKDAAEKVWTNWKRDVFADLNPGVKPNHSLRKFYLKKDGVKEITEDTQPVSIEQWQGAVEEAYPREPVAPIYRYDNIGEGGESWIITDPKAVKSAEPVTYEADGRVIPLSKRFNEESPLIAFAKSPSIETAPAASAGTMAGNMIIDAAAFQRAIDSVQKAKVTPALDRFVREEAPNAPYAPTARLWAMLRSLGKPELGEVSVEAGRLTHKAGFANVNTSLRDTYGQEGYFPNEFGDGIIYNSYSDALESGAKSIAVRPMRGFFGGTVPMVLPDNNALVLEDAPNESSMLPAASASPAAPATALSLFTENLPLATWFADKYRNIRGVEFEDLLQESRIGLWKAADRWESGRGIPFGGYASAIIRNRLNSLYEKNNVGKIDALTTLDAPYSEEAGSASVVDSVAARVEQFARPEDIAAINEEVSNLPEKPRRIWEMFLAGQSWREIGPEFKMSHERARQIALATGNTLRAALAKRGITTVDDVFPQKDAFNLDRLPERRSQSEDEENWAFDETATVPEDSEAVPVTMDGREAILTAPAFAATVFHGTPHKVDRFTTEKIGTGEGVQAYGWGLYFAETEAVAREYQRKLAVVGDRKDPWFAAEVRNRMDSLNEDYPTAFRAVYEMEGADNDMRRKKMDSWRGPRDVARPEGNFYTVEVNADREDLLDWDKPLGEQPQRVMEAFKAASKKPMNATYKKAFQKIWPFFSGDERTVREIYKQLAFDVGSEKDASEFLSQMGIPGIRYRDQGTRFAVPQKSYHIHPEERGTKFVVTRGVGGETLGEYPTYEQAEAWVLKQPNANQPTYNYVIFDESKIRIVAENGRQITPSEAIAENTTAPAFAAAKGRIDDSKTNRILTTSHEIPFLYTNGSFNRGLAARQSEGIGIAAQDAANAENDLGTGQGTGKTDEPLARRLAGLRRLKEFAAQNGLVLAAPQFRRLANANTEFAEPGAEHSVYLHQPTSRVIKLTHDDGVGDGTYGAKGSAADYLQSLWLSNLVLKTDNRFEGIVDLGGGAPQIVTSQDLVKNARKATMKQIAADLKAAGFTRVEARKDVNLWEHKGADVKIYDAVPSNVLRSEDGVLHYIDVDVIPRTSIEETLSRLDILPTAPAAARSSSMPDADRAGQTAQPASTETSQSRNVDDAGVLPYAYLNGTDALQKAHDRFGGPQGLLRSVAQRIGESQAAAYQGNDPKAAGYDEVRELKRFARGAGLMMRADVVRSHMERNAMRSGNEHKVADAIPSNRVLKDIPANKLATESLYDYLTDFELSNHYFGDSVNLEGLYEIGENLHILTSQPFRSGVHPLQDVLQSKLAEQGLESESPTGSSGIYVIHDERAGDIFVTDLHPKNAILLEATSAIEPIDVHFYFDSHAERLAALQKLGLRPDSRAPGDGATLPAAAKSRALAPTSGPGELRNRLVKPNHVVVGLWSYPDYNPVSIEQIPHDGTLENIATIAEQVLRQVSAKQDLSTANTQVYASDERGRMKWIISPNGNISDLATPEGQYAAGDLDAFTKDRSRRFDAAIKKGDIDAADALLLDEIKHGVKFFADPEPDTVIADEIIEARGLEADGHKVSLVDDRYDKWSDYTKNLTSMKRGFLSRNAADIVKMRGLVAKMSLPENKAAATDFLDSLDAKLTREGEMMDAAIKSQPKKQAVKTPFKKGDPIKVSFFKGEEPWGEGTFLEAYDYGFNGEPRALIKWSGTGRSVPLSGVFPDESIAPAAARSPSVLPAPTSPLPAGAKPRPSAKADLELMKIEEEGRRARQYREDSKKAAIDNNGIGAQEFWKTHLSGRLDKLDFYAPGAKAAILDDRREEALVAATINAMMDTMRSDIQRAFGYPKFWQAQNKRLQQFLDEILPTAARLEVSHLDDDGNFVFRDFQMRSGIIPFAKARIMDVKPGQKFMDRGELFTVGELVDGKGFVLLRDMLAEDQKVIFEAFHEKFPESAHYLDRFIMPGQEEARYMGPSGTMTAEFNRHALRALFNDWPQELRDLFGPMPLPDMPYVEGYTPDVAEQKTIVAMIGSLLRRFKSGARKFKAGEARESGNVKNLFDGFSVRAMEAHREKIRVQTRQKLIEAAAVPETSIPLAEREKYVPIDSTFSKLMEAVKVAHRLNPEAFPAIKEALSPADQRLMARILGDAYRLKGRGLMIHKEVERELMLGAARQVSTNALTKIFAGLLERYNGALLATPFTAITNWASNEIMRSMRVANRFNYAVLAALTGDARGAKLGAYEFGFLLRGFITDRFPQWQRERIGEIVPRELFDDQTGLEAMDIDPNKSVWEQLQRLNVGGAFLKAIQYGEIDIRQKQQLAYAAYRAHAEVAADEAGIKGTARRAWQRQWMQDAPADIHRDIYLTTVLYMMDYQNVPAWLDASQSNSAIGQVVKRAIIPFAKWPYNMAKQFKRFTLDSGFNVVMPGRTKQQRIDGAANLMVMGGLAALGAWLVGSDDDDDKLLGSNVDEEGKLLEAAFRTGNRLNVSRLARIIFAHGLMRGSTFSVTGAGGREEDLWWRYRNYPYLKEGLLMGMAAQGKWGEFGEAFGDVSGEYISLGLIAKVLGLSAFDRDKPVPYRTAEALYDVATAGVVPPPWRTLAVKVTDPVMRRSTPSEPIGYGATALDAIKVNTPGLSKLVPSVGQRKQVAFAPFSADEWFRKESKTVQKNPDLTPQEKIETTVALRQQAVKFSLPALTQRDIFRDAGLPVDKMNMQVTSDVPAASDIETLRRMGVGPESYAVVQNKAGQTRLTYPDPGTVRVAKPALEALRFFGGVNMMPAPRQKKPAKAGQPLTAKEMFAKP